MSEVDAYLPVDTSVPIFDAGNGGSFEGYQPRRCGEHRTVGSYRAWCHDCSEWCYPGAPCLRCMTDTYRLRQYLPGILAQHRADVLAEVDETLVRHGDVWGVDVDHAREVVAQVYLEGRARR